MADESASKSPIIIKKINKVMVRLVDSLGLKYGTTAADVVEYPFDEDLEISEFRDLKSGDYVLSWDQPSNQSANIRIQGDGPYPLQVQYLAADVDVADRFSSGR